MKKQSLILPALFLFSIVASFQPLKAQEMTKEEKENELIIQMEIDRQKKELVEQRRAQMEIQKSLEKNQKLVDSAFQDVRMKFKSPDNYSEGVRNFLNQRGTRSNSFDEPFIYSEPGTGFNSHFSGEGDRSSLDFSKSIKESNYSREYIFDVGNATNTVVMSITGDCKAGEIRVRILMPNGKTYSDVVIDESGNLNWRKSFNIPEEENKDKTGEWKFYISALNATGYFKISLQTF